MVLPNPFLSKLLPPLREIGVDLVDFSFNNNAANLSDLYINIAIRRFNAGVRITLDSVNFIAINPNWEQAPQLVEIFDQVSHGIREVTGATPKSQESTLAFHVSPGQSDFKEITASLVKKDILGDCLFYGLSLHKAEEVLIIDKSVRYEGAAFVRLQRKFSGDVPFAHITSRLYKDEINALSLLGISDVP